MRQAAILAVIAMLSVSCADVQEEAAPTVVKLSSFDSQVNPLLEQMTLQEKIGQMVQAECTALTNPEDIKTYFLGSVLSGGNGDPATNSLEDWTNMIDGFQSKAMETRLGIPLLYGIDSVHGTNNVLGAVVFPHNIGLGCTRNPELVEQVAQITAVETRATGANWTFAPCVAVPQDDRWGRTYEGFSEDPAISGELGAAAVRGFQGLNLSDPLRVVASVKHYAGDGGTQWKVSQGPRGARGAIDQGDVVMEEPEFRRLHIAPYLPSIEAGGGTIMPSYSTWNGIKCSAHTHLLTDILKQELGFEGFLISDYNAIDQITVGENVPADGRYREQIKISTLAGMDMFMVPTKYAELYGHLIDLVNAGEIPMTRIDDAVRRILRVKAAMGLLDKSRNHLADRSLHKVFGSAEHREVARQAVRESVVLLKNENSTLPLRKGLTRIHVAGKSADDIGNQCGGWTISWQGESGDVMPGGTTILQAIRNTASAAEVTFSADGTGAAGADVAVVVVGETPYAEMFGDRADLSLDEADRTAIANAKAAGIPVVVVLFSGRVMIINDQLEASDAFLAAWLPGTEGQGIADVLFGDYAPTGKLSFTWPRSMDQIPINAGDGKQPLFALGYGLSY